MHHTIKIPRLILTAAFLLPFAELRAATDIHFIPATPDQTCLADGSLSPSSSGAIGWKWLPDHGNDGIWESIQDLKNPPSTMMVKAGELEAGQIYEVFAYFWAQKDPSSANDSIQLGLSLATMHPFDGERTDEVVQLEPWVITPGYKTGEAFGLNAAVEEQDPLLSSGKLVTSRENEQLIRARLGFSRASKDGTLPVFFSSNTGSRSPGVARMDGIALRRAAADASPNQGRKPGTMLHLAIRAGDSVTIQRELEAGADVNAFDEENLTALFFAAAAGDSEIVRKLLNHGANPEQPGQSILPLVAAASIADTSIIRLLLGSGAKVPTSPDQEKGALAIDINPLLLHPVVAAVNSGSVPALKMLLAANPNLSLAKFEEEMHKRAQDSKPKLSRIYLLGESMARRDWDMAAFLIESGVHITCYRYDYYTSPQGLMLADAVHAWPDARLVMEAMLRRGEPAITKEQGISDDALNTAALHGNVELVRRFLPQIKEAGAYYQTGLLEKALASGNEEVVAMVRSRFPKASAPRWQPDSKQESTGALDESAKRWLLPRTTPPPQAEPKPAKGKHVLAVVAAPDARDVGDLLAVHASQADAWQVVDREQVDAALTEERFAKPWADGEHRLADLGDRLKADGLMVITAIRVGKETIHRFEIVETATGMEIHREHFRSDAFVDKKEVSGFLERAAHALNLAGRNERHQAVTLLSFSSQGGIGSPLALTGLLRAAVQHEVDATPGLISLSRAQSARLVEEQALAGKDSVWGAAHMIEGSLAAQGDGNVKVTLRLETIKDGGSSTKTDAEAVGKTTAIAETAAAAWNKLMAASETRTATTEEQAADRNRARIEGRRLMREADWLHAIHADPSSYLPLIESALALGVPAKEIILLDLDARMRNFMFLFPSNSYAHGDREDKHSAALQHLPDLFSISAKVSLAHSDQLASLLPLARGFLHQTSWYLEHLGQGGLEGGTDLWQVHGAYKSNEVWFAIQALSIIRTLIYPSQISDDLRPEWVIFSEELDALTNRYFSLLQTVPNPDSYRYYLQVADFRILERNPALAEGLIAMAAAGASPVLLIQPSLDANGFQWAPTSRHLAQKMMESLSGNPAPAIRLARADLECFLADAAQRPEAIRQLLDVGADTRWHLTPTREKSGSYLLSQGLLNRCTTSHLFDWQRHISSLEHNGSLIPSALFSNKMAPDLLIRSHTYHKIFHVINQREAWGQQKSGSQVDKFRENIGAYYAWELSRLKSDKTKLRPVNGAPSRSGMSLQGGPPGTMSKPAAKELHAMVFGAGKGKAKENQKKPEQAPVKKPEPKALDAPLLADLRVAGSPGTIIWPLVDNSDPNQLWVYHFPSDRDAIFVNQAGGDGAMNYGAEYENRILYKAPWLLGVDCRSGDIRRKINLHAAVGEAYGLNLSNRKCDVWRMGLDQTKDRILTSVGWHDENYSGNKMGSIIIDKKTGKAHPIPRNPEISESKGEAMLDLWDRNNGVAAVGEHFFYLDMAGEWTGGAIKGIRSSELAVFQVSPDLSVKPLTIMGRRPELTPFDAQNRAPISITPHGKRLMVIHPSTIAEYDPVANDWEITASLPSEKPTNKHTNTVADAQLWEYLRSINELRTEGKSTGWMALGWWQRPGLLSFASREKGTRAIPIHVTIPDDFLATTHAIEEVRAKDGTSSEKQTLMKNHPRFKKPILVVLAQTDTDLILGVQTSNNYEWKHPSRNSHHLPFLWKVSKTEIMERLEQAKPHE